MRSFLNNLVRCFRTTKTARPAQRPPRRASLRLEALEDRLVPTTLALFQPSLTSAALTLSISNIAPGHTIEIQCESNANTMMEVLDNGSLVNNEVFNKLAITAVNIQAPSSNNVDVIVNDSNGMPFAQGATITLSNVGELQLYGTRTVSGNETYVAGSAALIQLDNLTFNLVNSPVTVVDTIPITGTLDVQTSGANVQTSGGELAYDSGQISGMGFAGGILDFASKPTVVLEEYAAGASLVLGVPTAASLNTFVVNMHGAGDTTTIDSSPGNVQTVVNSVVPPVANPASVFVDGNSGPVSVDGNSLTQVTIGNGFGGPLSPEPGAIQANVTVNGAGSLDIYSGNGSTPENVLLTPSSISGNGLFGNSAVTIFYYVVGALTIGDTSTGAADFSISATSTSPQTFTSHITIIDESSNAFRADAFVSATSNLNVLLVNDSSPQGAAELVIHPSGVNAIGDTGTPNGVADVYSGDTLVDQLTYVGFEKVLA